MSLEGHRHSPDEKWALTNRERELEALKIKRDIAKMEMNAAQRKLSHAIRMSEERVGVIEAEAKLAKLKGQESPMPPEDFEKEILTARGLVEETQSRLADIERQIAEV